MQSLMSPSAQLLPRLVIWCILVILSTFAMPAHASKYTLCAEPGAGPPWFFLDQKEQSRPAGFSVALLKAAFARLGHDIEIRGDLPWPRCMALVARGEIDFAFDAYRDSERESRFVYSSPYQVLTPKIFFRKSAPIQARDTSGLAHYQGCGLHGSSYAHYGLNKGDLDQGTSSFAVLIQKLKIGRCDYFPEELESIVVLSGTQGGNHGDPLILHRTIKGARAPARHLITARGGKAAELLPAFDHAISDLYASGVIKALWHKNVGMLPYKECPSCGFTSRGH